MELTHNTLLPMTVKAIKSAISGGPWKNDNLEFEYCLEEHASEMTDNLIECRFKLSPKFCFMIDSPVTREVFASVTADCAFNRLLYGWINPVLEPTLIDDAYSCRVGKGTLYGINRLEHFIRSVSENYTRQAYVLHLDISGFFMSIDRSLLKDIILDSLDKRKNHFISCSSHLRWDDILDFSLIEYMVVESLDRNPIDNVVFNSSVSRWAGFPAKKSMFMALPGFGLTIGDILSQIYSNLYLNLLDQYAKRKLLIRCYGRYVDDIFVVGSDIVELQEIAIALTEFLKKRMSLQVNQNKTFIRDVYSPVPYLGQILMPHFRLPSERSVCAFRKAMWDIRQRIDSVDGVTFEEALRMNSIKESYVGYLSKAKSYRLIEKTLDYPEFDFLDYVIRRGKEYSPVLI